MKQFMTIASILLVFFVIAPNALATKWAHIPAEVFLDQADLVVVGKMTQVDKKAGTGIIEVSKVIKGKIGITHMKTRFSQWTNEEHPPMKVYFSEGDERIWIAVRPPEDGVYWFPHPGMTLPVDKLDWAKKSIRENKKRQWNNDPDSGLSVSLVVGKSLRENQWEIFICLRNDSKSDLRLCKYNGTPLVEISIVDPSGNIISVDPYKYIKENLALPPLHKNNFITLAPDEKTYEIFYSGIATPALTVIGTYTITVSYQNPHNGNQFGLKNVFVGKITCPEYELVVAEKE